MKSQLLYSLFLVSFLTVSIKGETKPDEISNEGISVGINLFNAYPFPFTMKNEHLKYFEPNLKVPLSNAKYFWTTSIGYTEYGKNPVYNNLDYTVKGVYIKTGIETNAKADGWFSNGIALCFSRFTESGTFFFEGNYFNNYEIPFPNRLKNNFFVEPYFMLRIPFFKLISFEPRLNVDLFFEKNNTDIPTYYIPGSGYTNSINFINASVDFKLFLKL